MRMFTIFYPLMGEMCSMEQLDKEKALKALPEADRERVDRWMSFATRGDSMKLKSAAVLCLSPKTLSKKEKLARQKMFDQSEREAASSARRVRMLRRVS